MINDIIKYRHRTFWILQFTLWTMFTGAYLFFYHQSLRTWRHVLGVCIISITGFVITTALRYIYRRTDAVAIPLASLTRFAIVFSFFGAVSWYILDQGLSVLVNGSDSLLRLLKSPRLAVSISSTLMSRFTLITGWSASYFAYKIYTAWVHQKYQTEEAQALAQAAQLQMLRYQLNPHFLFNALNALRALVDENRQQAKDMITELSEFLRYSLINKEHLFVPLSEEINAMGHYLSIEKKRFEEKLAVTIHIDPGTESCAIPGFLIHPLVENAIKYGMKTSSMPLRIQIESQRLDDILLLTVSNTGQWINRHTDKLDNLPQGTRTGLENITRRLENAYGESSEMHIEKSDGRVSISVSLPLNEVIND